MAHNVGAGFTLQMDSNSHLGKDVIENDVNEQNMNSKLFVQFLERMPNLTLTRGIEKSILDVYVTCEKVLPYITKMIIAERRHADKLQIC